MLNCPRCHNNHWTLVGSKPASAALLLLTLRRRYRCLKCDRVMTASIFRNMTGRTLLHGLKKRNFVRCPTCGQPARRSHRRVFERMVPFLRVFRCNDCKYRFRHFGVA